VSEIDRDLHDLGLRLWPDDTVLHPQPHRRETSMERRRSALLTILVGTGTAVLVLAVVIAGVLLTRSRTATPAPATEARTIGAMHMLTANDGWGWSDDLVARTTDGGTTFADVTPPGLGTHNAAASLTAIDMEHAWLLVTRYAGRVPSSVVYRTDDGGTTWTVFDIDAGTSGLTFIDAEHGWADVVAQVDGNRADHVELLRTVDGGATWSTVYQTTERISISGTPSQTGECQFSLPTFVTPQVGVAPMLDCPGAIPYIDMTEDGGTTWRQIALPQLDAPPGIAMSTETMVPVFTSASVGSVFATVCVTVDGNGCATYGAFFRTTNGGLTWVASMIVRGDPPLISPGEAWVVEGCIGTCPSWSGTPVLLLHTSDLGVHWTSSPLATALALGGLHADHDFQFVNSQVGFDITAGEFEPTRYYRTVDGGISWSAFTPRLTHT
jgi:photosystem II stability/assembly factor-like uncharacterized protein